MIVLCTFAKPAIATDSIDINWYVDGENYSSSTCEYGGDIIIPSTNPTKYGYTFVGWEPAVRRIEYLESTGTQYIDTGIVPKEDTYVEMDFQYTSLAVGNQVMGSSINGCRQAGETSKRFYIAAVEDESKLRHVYGNTTFLTQNPLDRHYIKFNGNGHSLIVDDVFLGTLNGYSIQTTSSRTLWIFRGNNETPNNQEWFSAIKIYLLKIYDYGTLVLDLVPVLDANNVPCMYDTVSGQFFYNAGTGDFIVGPEIGDL